MTRLPTMPSRRGFIASGAALIAAPAVVTHPARAATQLRVRTPGGAFDEIKRRTVYEPFLKETGIEIVPVPSTVGKLLAMYKAGQVEIDCIDTGDDANLQLEQAGALVPIDYGAFRRTDLADIEPGMKLPYQIGSFVYAFVLCYRTDVFKPGSEPKDWAGFWDLKAYPGPRTLAGMESGSPNLEIALIADGVPMDAVYPVDIDRALRSMSRIKAAVPKFWDSGALSAQMLSDREAVLGVLWNPRAQASIDGGAPLAIQWNQNQVLVQSYAIPKGSKAPDAALQFIDYTVSAEVQQRWLTEYKAIPVNRKAYPHMSSLLLDPATGTPWTVSKGFRNDIHWWLANRAKVSRAWSNWVL